MARIAGRSKLSRRWRELPLRLQSVLKPSMAAGADTIVHQMQALAPENRWPQQKKPWQVPGTLKRSINWIWTGIARITIAALPHEMINLGLWNEKGTKPSKKGSAYRFTYWRRRRKKSYRRDAEGNFVEAPEYYETANARTAQRSHPGTKAQPFFVIVWRAARGRLFGFVRDAAKKGLQ